MEITGQRPLIIKRQLFFACKRAADIVIASAALTVLSPVFLAAAAAVMSENKGGGRNVIFKQTRLGKNGVLFYMYKFRTMINGADDLDAALSEAQREEYRKNKKLENDPRVTRVGKFLRETSLDELPQLVNILFGYMSLIGPRPYIPNELQNMQSKSEIILSVKPGLTGLWQVNGRSAVSHDRRLELEMYYAENAGFLLDLHIFIKTFPAVLLRKGAK